MLGSVNVANAATFNFSFSNVVGNIDGNVSGTITLPDGDGTFTESQISNLTVNSAPTELGFSLPLNVLTNFTEFVDGTFNVVGGQIVKATSSFLAVGGGTTRIFSLNDSGGNGSALINLNSGDNTSDQDSSTLVYSPASPPATTPEPTSVITLIGVGVLGVASKKLKKKA